MSFPPLALSRSSSLPPSSDDVTPTPTNNQPSAQPLDEPPLFHKMLRKLARFHTFPKDCKKKCFMGMVEKEKEELGSFFVLPREIIPIILDKIPTNSLLVLKSLNFGWYCRILHHMGSRKSRNKMVLLPSSPLNSVSLLQHSVVDLPLSSIPNGHRHVIVGSIEGVLLLVNPMFYLPIPFLYNPVTNNMSRLPPPPPPTEAEIASLMCDSRVFGVGYGKVGSDVKVVVLSRSRAHKGMCSQSFSLLRKDWTQIPFSKRPITISSFVGTFVEKSRRLYWIAQHDLSHIHLILSLDLTSMLFDEIGFEAGVPIQTLGTIHGRLCKLMFFDHSNEEDSEEVAEVDEEHGAEHYEEAVKEDWTEEDEYREDKVQEKNEEEEDEEEDAEDEGVLPLEEPESWSTQREGIYQLQVLVGENSWNTIVETDSLVDDKQFGELCILTFLDHGGILIKAVNKTTRYPALLLRDLVRQLCLELTTPPTLLVGSTHASEYVETYAELPSFGPPSSNSSNSSGILIQT